MKACFVKYARRWEAFARALKAFAVVFAGLFALSTQADSINSAYDGKGNDWFFSIVGGEAKIYNNGSLAVDPEPTGGIQIPTKFSNYFVTLIGGSAFKNCKNITRVSIPSLVKEIHSEAFRGCSSLQYMSIPMRTTKILNAAFQDCSGLLFVKLPDGLTTLGSYAFYGCSSLMSMVIPDSLQSLDKTAFQNCSSLRKVLLPASMSIPEDAFKGCSPDLRIFRRQHETVSGIDWSYYILGGQATVYNIDRSPAIPQETSGDITVPATLGDCPVTTIGPCAFYECEAVNSITIPASVASIGDEAFSGCLMRRVDISSGVTSIGDNAFANCDSLTNISIPASVTSIGDGAFANCDLLESLTLPDSVTSLGDSVFRESYALKHVTLSPNLTSLGDSVFYQCLELESIVIPPGVTSIGEYAFYDCDALKSVAVPASVTSIGEGAFDDCDSLATIYVEPGDKARIMTMFANAFYNTDDYEFVEAYTVTFDANGGTSEERERVCMPGTALGALPGATRAGYTCLGWFTAPAGGAPVAAGTLVTASMKLYAQWQPSVAPQPEDASGYAFLDKKDIAEPYTAKKAQTLLGAVYGPDGVAGVVELKFGKPNPQKQTCKISGTLTMLDGKKYTVKSQTIVLNQTLASSATLFIKRLGTLSLAFGGTRFAGDLGAYHLQVARVGGAWTKGAATAKVAVGGFEKFPGTVIEALLPKSETASVARGKWAFKKAASVKWATLKGGEEALLRDIESGKGVTVDTAKGKTNLSGIKLAYTPKKGTFKGSFKVFALQGTGRRATFKRYPMSVNGAVVDGYGYGFATSKRPSIVWPVTVE